MEFAGRSLAHRAAPGRLARAALPSAALPATTALTLTLATTTTVTTAAATLGTAVLVVPRRTVVVVAATATSPAIAGVTVARGELDLELVELIPLLVSALAVGNRLQLLHASAG